METQNDSVHVHVQCRGCKTRSVVLAPPVREESSDVTRAVQTLGVYFGKKIKNKIAAAICLISVRPDVPRVAIVQLTSDSNLYLQIVYAPFVL